MESNKTLRDAAWNLAIGQSVGNPNVRNSWETDELFENASCIVLTDEDKLDGHKVSVGLLDHGVYAKEIYRASFYILDYLVELIVFGFLKYSKAKTLTTLRFFWFYHK